MAFPRNICPLTGRVRWLNRQPGINLGGITCTLYTDVSGVLLNKIRHVRGTLYVRTSNRPRGIAETINESPLALEIRLLEEDASKVGRIKELHGRRVGQHWDVGLLKRWIRIRRNKHREKCEAEWWRDAGEVLSPTVRVVDVARMAIVPAPPKCRYVTLSYVWGGPGDAYWTTQANLNQCSIPGGLDASMVPDTISDTIQLVRQLGERYLWIDALRIVQDDPQDKAV